MVKCAAYGRNHPSLCNGSRKGLLLYFVIISHDILAIMFPLTVENKWELAYTLLCIKDLFCSKLSDELEKGIKEWYFFVFLLYVNKKFSSMVQL